MQLFDLLFGQPFRRYGRLRRRQNKRDDVMDDLAIAGTRFGHLHVFVFREAGINQEVLVLVWSIGFEGELFRHLQDQVRLADAPPFDELRRRRQVARVAFFGAAVNPGGDGVNLVLGQATSFENWPTRGSACQGGISRLTTFSRMLRAQGRASL